MKPKEFKTLLLIYFLRLRLSPLQKHFDRHFSPPSSHMEFKGKFIKSISNSLPFNSSHVLKNLLSLGEIVVTSCAVLNSHDWDCAEGGSVYLIFFLDRTTPKQLLNG